MTMPMIFSHPCVCSESITMSVFILTGAELKGQMVLEGPVVPLTTENAREFNQGVTHYDGGHRYTQHVSSNAMIDFEHMNEAAEFEDDDDDDHYEFTMDDDDEVGENGERDMEKIKRKVEERRKRAHAAREKAREARRQREKIQADTAKKIREEGEPEQRTLTAKAEGWYRGCIKGSWYQLQVEMELRRSSELGGVDPDSGHVYSWEQKNIMDEEKTMEDMSAQDEGIKVEDFENTKKKMRDLRRLFSEIQIKQNSYRHRMTNHAQTNEHSHSRMVMSSLMQTVIFIAVTGFQVYTIRKWFSGSSTLLGR